MQAQTTHSLLSPLAIVEAEHRERGSEADTSDVVFFLYAYNAV